MTGIIVATPPTVELPPGSISGSPTLPPVTYQYAVTGIPQTWTALQTFPLGMISVQAADVHGTIPAGNLPLPTPSTLGGIYSPTSTTAGNIAFYNDTTGAALAAAPSFRSGNPGKAALYSQIANAADGYTTPNNGLQISIGTAMGATEQFGNNPVVLPGDHPGQQQAIVGTAQSSATDTAGNVWGVVGYGRANSANVNAIGIGGHGAVNVTNGSAWGMNAVVHNQSAIATNGGFDANWMSAAEFDVNIWKKAAGAEPTLGNLFGIYIYGSGDSTTTQGVAFATDGLNASTGAKWGAGFASRAGASVNAFVAGPTAKTGNNLSSQDVVLQSTNGAGAAINSTMRSDGSGNLIIIPNSGKMAVGLTGLAPDAPITINANTVAGPAPTASTNLHLVGADGVNNLIQLDAFSNGAAAGPILSGRLSRGTAASRSVPQSSDVLLNIQGQGYDTSAYSTGVRAQCRATETWSSSAHGSEYAIAVIANTTTTLTDALIVKNSGGVAIGTAADPGAGGLGASGLIKSSSATGGVGYATGAGGTVTQATSKSTGVTLNTVTGQITMNNASLSGSVGFTLTNSAIAATDVVIVNIKSGATVDSYLVTVDAVAAGSCRISLRNFTGGALLEAVVLQFAVFKGVNA